MLNNTLEFILYTFGKKKMVFQSQDGFAYQRWFTGIPSGMFNTQYLDSHCNLFVMIHAMLEYGVPPPRNKRTITYLLWVIITPHSSTDP